MILVSEKMVITPKRGKSVIVAEYIECKTVHFLVLSQF